MKHSMAGFTEREAGEQDSQKEEQESRRAGVRARGGSRAGSGAGSGGYETVFVFKWSGVANVII